MGILVDENTSVIVQGVTGKQGSFHTQLMLEYGTRVVAGVTPGKGGVEVGGVPVYDTVEEAMQRRSPDASVVFVPAPFAAGAVYEALDAGIKTVVVVTEHIPVKDAIGIVAYAAEVGARVIGPNTPGIITPAAKCKLGIMPEHVFAEGSVGVVSRSGTLTYEIAAGLTRGGFGQSSCLGVGGDAVVGVGFVEALELFRSDVGTEVVVLVGEIGGSLEELAAEYIVASGFGKPVVAYVAGRFAPVGKRMGHAGAIVLGDAGSVEGKVEAFRGAGVLVAEKPGDVVELVRRVLRC